MFKLAAALLAAGALTGAPVAFAADEICSSCDQQVSISGEFSHRRERPNVTIDGAGNNAAAYGEDVNGAKFSVSISHLPAGKYTVIISAAETLSEAAGDRLFSVSSGSTILATNFDIIASAGAARKVATITGEVQHEDDSLRGPLTLAFSGQKSNAKFNTITVKNAAGQAVISFAANELADAFSASAKRVPDVKEAPYWRDASRPLKDRINDLIRRMSLAEKVGQLQGGMNGAPAIPRLGLPVYHYWAEALHGVANNSDCPATVFPEPTGGACSWNPELFHDQGSIIGIEGRAIFNDYTSKHNGETKTWKGMTFWTPNVNIFRDPRWGRGQETYGEDPFLTAEIGIQFVKGIQGNDPDVMLAMACAKHYAVHSGPEADRHRMDVRLSDRDLYETYLPQFERVVREGKVAGVMGAYNSVNGVPCCSSPFLLDELLRKKWGFDGYVVSDCDAVADIWRPNLHHFVNTPEEAAAAAVKAGCNLCCGGDYNSLVRAAQQNLVTEKDIDNALYYTLWTRFRMGLFNSDDKNPYSKITIAQNDTDEHRAVALKLAQQSLVLLKNDGVLPIERAKYKKIAVIGPNAKSLTMLNGNYHGTPSKPVSILDGIKQLAGEGVEITYAYGCPVTTVTRTAAWSAQDNTTTRPLPELKAEALGVATNADLVIFVGGITAAQEGEGFDRTAIELPEVQEQFIRDLRAAVTKPVVMVNCSGSAMALTWENDNLAAILQAWYPGEEGGKAVGQALFGDINPSGRLAVTFYRATTDLPAFTNYSMANRTYRYFTSKPLYAFGYGLSYTTYEMTDGKLNAKSIPADGSVQVTFDVKNTGKMDGVEVAQVYFRHVKSSVEQPKLALCGFSRVAVKKGSSTTETVNVPAERFRYWDTEKKQYVVEPGEYEILVAAASDDIKLTLPLTVTAK
jgi:beta-glucosidase